MSNKSRDKRTTTASLVDRLRAWTFPKRLPAVPHHLTKDVMIPGIPKARYLVTMKEGIDNLVEDVADARSRLKREFSPIGHKDQSPPENYLAISGGGDKGAFAAGLITGWSESGKRPYLHVVTGISIGALVAPFAFVGPECDETLKNVFTNIGQKNIFNSRNVMAAILDDAIKDSTPLWNLMGQHVNEELLARIAEKRSKGPFLFVATTNLDARLPVVWNMGEIAASKHPNALDLFRKILLASASIPGVFPPVMIDVEFEGVPYQEMHVDGGAVGQVFLFPASLGTVIRDRGLWEDTERTAYIIRNARLDPEWASVDRRTLNILGRAISSLIQTQGTADLYHIYLTTEQNKIDFNLAFIGSDFNVLHKEDFDTEYMRALFDYAYQRAREGYHWHKKPSGLFDPHSAAE